MEQGSTSASTSESNGHRNWTLQPKHNIFLSHSGAQKGFVEQLCVDLERCDRHPFLDKRRDSLPIGKDFPSLIFQAIEQCEVGVVVLSDEFFTSKWPMLELGAMNNVKKRNPSFTIVLIFLGITFSQYLDRDNQNRWLSTWRGWEQSDSRIDVEEWENALQLFRRTNALKYNRELGEVKFREEIVEEICKLVPSETRFDDSHIQGRSRLCKVIHEKIKQSGVSTLYGLRIVGVYGVGGIGKTTVCKIMCNDLSKEYRGKVAHVELGSQSEHELLKEVLRRLTDTNLERLGAMNVDEYRDCLMRDMMNAKVFLTIDNVSSATINQALTLLRANYAPGSVVLVTARSLYELTSLRINASQCMEMPEIEKEEAKALFLHHAVCVPPNKAHHELISSCVQHCYFQKGDGMSSHYHPLALQTLGGQLGCVGYVPEQWRAILNEIDSFNPFREPQHPVFSILRKSFDALNAQDQLLFMDAALFEPYWSSSWWNVRYKWNLFEWFGMVHGIRVNTVIERLENLKRKSLVENLGDGSSRIGMHDLWREFARLETKVGEFETRRWMFEWDEHNVLEESKVTMGGSWGNLRRMFFQDGGFMKLEEVDFDCFPNVTVLKLTGNDAIPLQLDLSGLKHLKSLELELRHEFFFSRSRNPEASVGLGGLSSLTKLSFLRWRNIPSDSPCIDEIGRLTKLQVLDLHGGGRLPDLSSLVLLQVACFDNNDTAETITGLSSKHTNLRYLDLEACDALQSCPGVGELVALEELRLSFCSRLTEVPDLQKLKRLRIIYVSSCGLLTALPGLGDLVSLQELRAGGCTSLVEFPDLRNLSNLRILELHLCRLVESLPGLDELLCLQSLDATICKNLTHLPDMCKLTNLQSLKLDPNSRLQSAAGLSDMVSLRILQVGFDESLHDWPDLCKLTKLEKLSISWWQAHGFSNVENFVCLESITVDKCKGVRAMPDLERLTRLNRLEFRYCGFEDMSGLSNLTSVKHLTIQDCDNLEAVPDLRKLTRLISLEVVRCARLRDFRGVLALHNLEYLEASGHPWLHENLGADLRRLTGVSHLDVSHGGFADLQAVAAFSQLHTLKCCGCPIQELPDLAKFPKLTELDVRDCVNLTVLTCTGPLSAKLRYLDVQGCRSLRALPDLSNVPDMRKLNVANSGVVMSPEFIMQVKARWPYIDLLTELPFASVCGKASSQESGRGVAVRQPVLSKLLFSLLPCCAEQE